MLFAYINANSDSLKVCILIEELELDCKYFTKDLCGKVSISVDDNVPLIIDGANFVYGTENILVYLTQKWGPQDESIRWKYKISSWLLKFRNMSFIEELYRDDEFIFRLEVALNDINDEIRKNEFLVGSEFTIADISLWSELYNLKLNMIELDLTKYKYIDEYYKKISKMNSITRASSIIHKNFLNENIGLNSIFSSERQKVGGLNVL